MHRVDVSTSNWPNLRVRPWTSMVRPGTTAPVTGSRRPSRSCCVGTLRASATKALDDRRGVLLWLQLCARSPDVQVLDPHPEWVAPQFKSGLPKGWDLGRRLPDAFLGIRQSCTTACSPERFGIHTHVGW